MTDLVMKDAATLDNVNDTELHDTDAWAGYISGACEHIWTDDEWRRVSAFPKLPIVCARPDKTGKYCGLEAIMALYKLGVPRSTAVAFDLELFFLNAGNFEEALHLASQSLSEFYDVMLHFGYVTWKYGSLSYTFELPPVDGTWIATDSKKPEQYQKPGVHATQWLFAEPADFSLIHRIAVHHRLAEVWRING